MPPNEHPALPMCLPTTCTTDPPPKYPDRGYSATASAGLRNSYSTSISPFIIRSPPDPTATNPSFPPGTVHTISAALLTVPWVALGPITQVLPPPILMLNPYTLMDVTVEDCPADGTTASTASAAAYEYCTSSFVYPTVRKPASTLTIPASRPGVMHSRPMVPFIPVMPMSLAVTGPMLPILHASGSIPMKRSPYTVMTLPPSRGPLAGDTCFTTMSVMYVMVISDPLSVTSTVTAPASPPGLSHCSTPLEMNTARTLMFPNTHSADSSMKPSP
mmetsp:Transcript_18521/g.46058  ORF Transcript_18521/g.46058 Transcript_18521/m.46058 type:complete len:274 (-) Transcript_18521:17-838(-)